MKDTAPLVALVVAAVAAAALSSPTFVASEGVAAILKNNH
jgi:hypothetical protein